MQAGTRLRPDVDALVASAMADGDVDRAATTLIEGYGPQVRCYLRALLRNEEEAADTYALFAESVWRGLPTWGGRSGVRAWAFRVAWNSASRTFRDPWLRRREPLPESAASKLAEAIRSTTSSLGEHQRRELEALRGLLSLEEQSLLVLRVDRDLSWQEVAVALGVRDDAAGRAALRKRFERLKAKLASGAHAHGLI
jgi:RNA polymerase sigma-70 factor, ECF subfamily